MGCATAQRMTAPLPRAPLKKPDQPAALKEIKLELCSFWVKDGPAFTDKKGSQGRLEKAFLNYLRSEANYASVKNCPVSPTPLGRNTFRLYASLDLEKDSSRTYLLDVIAGYPFLGTFPLVPSWGRIKVNSSVSIETPAGRLDPLKLSASAPYSMIFYSWYRSGPEAEGYQYAYEGLFAELSRRIYKRAVEYTQSEYFAQVQSSTAAEPPHIIGLEWVKKYQQKKKPIKLSKDPEPIATEIEGTDMWLISPDGAETEEPGLLWLPERGFRVVAEPVPEPKAPAWWWEYLKALGGVEAGLAGGIARVSSNTRNEAGRKETVASGKAVSQGYRISLFNPPKKTGFFYPPRLGFFSQDIEIQGFQDDLSDTNRRTAGTIPAVITDPNNGSPVDVSQPISYFLRLKSGYIGQTLGLNLVLGTDTVQFYGSLSGSLNVFEVRNTQVELQALDGSYGDRSEGWSAVFFGSGQATLQGGIVFPKIHLALKVGGEWEFFRDFEYPEELEFQAAATYNPAKQIYERRRAFVEGAQLWTANWQVSAILLF